jgi:hypothetical protein
MPSVAGVDFRPAGVGFAGYGVPYAATSYGTIAD